jgi:oligosaccharide repeat unit polymerase
MIIIVLLSIVTTLLLSRLLFRTVFAPLGVFGMVWGFSLSTLCLTTLADYPLGEQTWFLILGAWISFLLASTFVGLARATVWKGQRNINADLSESPAFRVVLKSAAIIAVLGSLRFAYTVISIAGWDSWLQDSLNLRYTMTAGDFSTGTSTYFFQGITMAAAALGGIWVARAPRFLPAYLPLLAAGLSDLFFFGRSHTLLTIGIFASGFLLSRTAFKVRWVTLLKRRVVPVMLVGTLFVAIPFGYVTQTRRGPLQELNPLLLLDYTENLSMNWYLVEDVVRTQTASTPGVNTFFPFSMLAHSLGLREVDPREERLFSTSRQLPTGRASNTYTLVGAAYADYATWGTWLLLFCEGVLMSAVFVVYQRRRRLWSMVALAFVYPMLLFSVQGDQLSSPQFNVGVLLGIGLAVYITQLRHKPIEQRARVHGGPQSGEKE